MSPGNGAIQVFIRYLPLLILVVVWEAIARSGWISQAAMPSLESIARSWWRLVTSGDLWSNGSTSLFRYLIGIAAALTFSVPVGILMAYNHTVQVVVGPLIAMFYPLPKAALIPVLLLWFGLGEMSKIALIFLGCMLPIVLSAYNGARGMDRVLAWSARSLGASRAQVLWEIVLPAALPEILAGFRAALSLSFAFLIAAELTISRDGIGHLIGFLGESGVYEPMFAAIFTVAAFGFLVDRTFLAFMRRTLAWRA